MLVVRTHIHAQQLRPDTQQASHLRKIAGLHCLGRLLDIHSVHERLDLGPALVSVRPRQHALRIVEGKRRRIGPALELFHFGCGRRIAGAVPFQQIFGLFSQLLEVRMLWQPSRWMAVWDAPGHNDLLSSDCPASAYGRKEDSSYLWGDV